MSAPGDSSGPGGTPGEASPEDPEPPSAAGLSVEIVHDGGRWGEIAPDPAIIQAAMRAFAHVAREFEPPSEVVLLLTDDAHMRELNRVHRGHDKPTNVLSFPSGLTEPSRETGRIMLGDVALAAGTVLSEAQALAIAPRDHALHLAVHGVLHLLGYDHDSEEEARTMEGVETAVLASLGIADPHAGTAPANA